MGSLDVICGDRGKRELQCVLRRRVEEFGLLRVSLPCPVSHQNHLSFVGCAAEPGKPFPGVSEPFVLLTARVGLWKKQTKKKKKQLKKQVENKPVKPRVPEMLLFKINRSVCS